MFAGFSEDEYKELENILDRIYENLEEYGRSKETNEIQNETAESEES